MRGVLVVVLVPIWLGCAVIRLDFNELPAPEALASIEPGVTTRSEVLRRLGPPEEMRIPAPFDRVRQTTPIHRKVLEAHDVFGAEAYTYARGRRDIRTYGIMPVGLVIFRVLNEHSTEERWRIEFDGDLVATVSHVDEIGEQ